MHPAGDTDRSAASDAFTVLVGRRIKQAREQAGLTLEQLCTAVGVARQNLSAWESGKKQPRLDRIPDIARETGQPYTFFVDPTPQAPPASPPAVTPDLAAIVAQAVGQAVSQALEPLVQAQVQMQEAMAALARERMESRAEMARTQRKIREMENDLRQMGEEDDEEDCPGQDACSG